MTEISDSVLVEYYYVTMHFKNSKCATHTKYCVRYLPHLEHQIWYAYLPTIQGFPGLSRDLGSDPGIQGSRDSYNNPGILS